MKKLLLILCILGSTTFASFAQTDTSKSILMSLGADVGVVTGPATKTFSSTTGLSFKFEFPFHDRRASFILSAAYINFNTKSTPLTDTMQNGHFVPLEIGFKYFVHKNIYLEGDLGESLNINTGYLGYQNSFIYSPVVGMDFPVKQNTAAVDISLRYESRVQEVGSINQFALRLAYKFGL